MRLARWNVGTTAACCFRSALRYFPTMMRQSTYDMCISFHNYGRWGAPFECRNSRSESMQYNTVCKRGPRLVPKVLKICCRSFVYLTRRFRLPNHREKLRTAQSHTLSNSTTVAHTCEGRKAVYCLPVCRAFLGTSTLLCDGNR